MINKLKLKVIFPVTESLDGEELSEVQRMSMGLKDGDQYESEWGFYDYENDIVLQLNPKCFKPKDRENKKYYTQVVFSSELIVYADGKPEVVAKAIEDYVSTLPKPISS
jgi:hypothetical protein